MRLCVVCNGALGRTFEEPASLLLEDAVLGKPTVFTPAQKVVVAAWTTKTALMGNLAISSPGDWAYDLLRNTMLKLIATRHPPPWCSVWIGRVPLTLPVHEADAAVAAASLLRVDSMPRFAWFSLSSAGHFVWEVVVGPPASISRFVQPTAAGADVLDRIWPLSIANLSWPERFVSETLMTEMRSAFMGAAKPGMNEPFARTWSGPTAVG